jgi:hypothetical protein
MRQVRSEPRPRRGLSPRPLLAPLVAVVLAAAAIAGISRLDLGGGMSSGASAGAGSAGGGSELNAAPSKAPATSDQGAASTDGRLVVRHVPYRSVGAVFGVMVRCPAADGLSVTVPNTSYDSIAKQLQALAGEPGSSSPRVDVYLHHAPRSQKRVRVTCP